MSSGADPWDHPETGRGGGLLVVFLGYGRLSRRGKMAVCPGSRGGAMAKKQTTGPEEIWFREHEAHAVVLERHGARAFGRWAIIRYNLDTNRIELADGEDHAVAFTKFAFAAVLCGLAVVEGNWTKAREFTRTGQGMEEFVPLFAGVPRPAFFFLWVRLYSRHSPLEAKIDAAVERVRMHKAEFCESFSEPGVCEVIACLSRTKERSIINRVIEREKRNIPKAEGEEATLPPVPTEEKRGRGRPPKVKDLDIATVEKAAQDLLEKVVPLETRMIALFQDFLDDIAGKAPLTAEDSQKLAKFVAQQADRYGMTLLCRDKRREGDGLFHPIRLNYEMLTKDDEEGSLSGRFTARLWGSQRPIYAAVLFPQLLTWHGVPD
jgi:hypothetical protein